MPMLRPSLIPPLPPPPVRKYGYKQDKPDSRDHVMTLTRVVPLPPSMDLRYGMPPVYDQGSCGSCTANAIAAAIDYERNLQKLPFLYPSRLFIYYQERVIENTVPSDDGAQIRDGIKSVVRLGVPPESEWPYDVSKFAVKPPPSTYLSAALHQTLSYSRVSQSPYYPRHCLGILKRPIVFGFQVYDQFESAEMEQTGIIKIPDASVDTYLGGHAVLAVGYDDAEQMYLCRNSWGSGWGPFKGYFKMPYAYFLNPGLCSDLWTVLAE